MNMLRVWGRMMISALLLAASACDAGNDSTGEFQASVHLSDEATTADVGLPGYPGAKPFKDDDDPDSGASIGLSTSLFGFRVVALELQSDDKPERVAAFYRKALSKYGAVLECRGGTANGADKPRSDDALTCESDDDGKHDVVYKVGTKHNQRLVAIEALGDGTRMSLVRVDMRDNSKH